MNKPLSHSHTHYARDLLLVFLGNTLITTMLWLAGMRGGFGSIWLISQCIGFGICFSHTAVCKFSKAGKPYGWRLAVGITAGATFGMGVAYLLGVMPDLVSRIDLWTLVRMLGLSLIIGAVVSLFFYNREQISALKISRQATELRELASQKEAITANLKLLQAQIEPHFLFNTLANLHSLIGQNDALARTLLERLNDYLRASLVHSRAEVSTLADECRLLAAYLDIQALRMGGRLSWQIDIAKALQALAFPPMLLQPLVENAISHGIEPRIGAGKVEISASIESQRLKLTVRDDGRGLGHASNGHGVGLSNVRERLAALYGSEAELILRDNQPSGVIAELWIPLPAPAP